MPETEKHTEIHCKEAREILDHIPRAILWWGNAIMLMIIAVIALVAFIVKIPVTSECGFNISFANHSPEVTVFVPASSIDSLCDGDLSVVLQSKLIPDDGTFRCRINPASMKLERGGVYAVGVELSDADSARLASIPAVDITGQAFFSAGEQTVFRWLVRILK